MKKLSAAVAALLLLVTISACSGSSDSSSSDDYCSLLKKSQDSFGALGFDKLTNLAGGIDAWAINVDREMPRY